MNTKLVLSGVLTVALLSGCASVPQAPKDAKEMAEMGEENLLHVPIDISPFIDNWKKVKIISEKGSTDVGRDGDVGQTTIWTNPVDGKMYDLDGQPVNEKGERILRNGFVCKTRAIFANTRVYSDSEYGIFSNSPSALDMACRPRHSAERFVKKQRLVSSAVMGGLAAGGVIGATVAIGSIGASALESAIISVTADDTL